MLDVLQSDAVYGRFLCSILPGDRLNPKTKCFWPTVDYFDNTLPSPVLIKGYELINAESKQAAGEKFLKRLPNRATFIIGWIRGPYRKEPRVISARRMDLSE